MGRTWESNEEPQAVLATWSILMGQFRTSIAKPRVALVQRTIPHYRVPLFVTLAEDHRFDWTFFCGEHDGQVSPGLPAPLDGLKRKKITNHSIGRSFIWQSGVNVNSRDFDVILAEYGWTILSNPALFAWAKANGIATIGWSKGISQGSLQTKSNARRRFERASISLCDAVLAYGEISREYFLDLGVADDRIFVAQNAIDTTAIAGRQFEAKSKGLRLRAELGIPDSPIAGFLGRIGPVKRVDCLIGAFEYSASRGMKGSLLIAGRGPCSDQIDAMIRASFFQERIFRLKDVPAGMEDAVFQAMDLYVNYTQAGLGILEAMAHGIPIVATPERYPESELLIDGETAFLSEEVTVQSLGERLLSAVNDPEGRLEISDRARERVLQKATIENMKEQICQAVNFVLSNRPKNN